MSVTLCCGLNADEAFTVVGSVAAFVRRGGRPDLATVERIAAR